MRRALLVAGLALALAVPAGAEELTPQEAFDHLSERIDQNTDNVALVYEWYKDLERLYGRLGVKIQRLEQRIETLKYRLRRLEEGGEP